MPATPDRIYLDHAATTPVLPEVADAVRDAMMTCPGNASSQHAAGRAARRVLDDARDRIVELLGGQSTDRLILTSGATEANNHALRGALTTATRSENGHLITSAIEHPSIVAVVKRLEASGVVADHLPADRSGQVVLDELPARLRPDTRLISLMLANSETGVLQPVGQLVNAVQQHRPEIGVHTDATQAIGRHPVRFAELGVAMLSFAAHKFNGPKGVGGLLVRGDCRPAPLLAGQADDERPGTPPTPLVVGMLRALEIATAKLDERIAHLRAMRDRLEAAITAVAPDGVVTGSDAPRLPHTCNVALVGHDRQALLMALDRAGIACSTGSACASGSSEPSPVLLAMGLPDEQIRGALRFSVGMSTTADEVDRAVGMIQQVCQRL